MAFWTPIADALVCRNFVLVPDFTPCDGNDKIIIKTGHDRKGYDDMKKTMFAAIAVVSMVVQAVGRPAPSPALKARLQDGPEVIGIVHWGLNTYTDREWGFGNEDPAMLNPANFDADQIVQACKAGGIGGLVIVAKHHDGFCLWPTKTTGHNITKSPFRGGHGDYVREMEQACRKAGLKFGVYVSPWDRNSEYYATEKYVEIFNAQV